MTLPLWKVKREWQRLGQQVRAIPEAIWEPLFFARYNRRFPAELIIRDGQVAQTPRIALVLIFPRPSLAESVVLLCQGLAAAGYAPLVVSNCPLSAADVARLGAVSWRIVQRPNLGHDFGGYRDGIWLLRDWNIAPDELLILNDSIWVVDGTPDALLAALAATQAATLADVAGCILRERGQERFLESYCYRIEGHVLQTPGFRDYWNRLRLTSNKYKVIRRGERGHSAALASAGLKLAAPYGVDGFQAALCSADDAVLCETLRYGAYLYPDDAGQAQVLAGRIGEPGWRDQALGFVDRVLKRGQFYSTFPVAARLLLGYPVLKRSGDRVAVIWRQAYLRAVQAGVLPQPHPTVLAELTARVQKDLGKVDLGQGSA